MKKQILLTLVTLLTVTSAFAEREMSKIQYIETQSCETQELKRVIVETAQRIIFEESNLTLLEESLGLTTEQKAQGLKASVEGSYPRSSVSRHMKSVARAEAQAKTGEVGVTAPAKFDVVFNIKDASQKIISRGRVMLDVACRVELRKNVLRHAGQLISFDIQAKRK